MKGDFTRLGFDPAKGFTRVLMQQGRVQLDSDWNEKQEIDLHAARAALCDVAAPFATVAGTNGFAIAATDKGNDLKIGTGRLYAGGILCENAMAGATLSNQPFLGLRSGGRAGFDWPAPKHMQRYLVYLDVWERDVSALEQPGIRETALGGPDTTSRTRLIWQVRLEEADTKVGTEGFPPGWMPLAVSTPAGVAPGAMLAATTPAVSGPSALPPGASYTSLSNQLYRVEVHTGGSLGSGSPPTFKWSRENGSVATTVTAAAGQTLTVADLGPDDRLRFLPGQTVELIDDWMGLSAQAGPLLLIDSIDTQRNTITIASATTVPQVDFTKPVLLRRWDQPGVVGSSVQAVAMTTSPVALEAGIQLQFQPGFYPAGAWWTFPARTAIDAETGNIVWPAPAGTFLPPQGPAHIYVPLALVDFIPSTAGQGAPSGQFIVIEDCRAQFSPAAGRLAPMHARYAESGHQAPLTNEHSMRLDVLAQGLVISTPVKLDASSVSPNSVQLFADVPVTFSQMMPGSTDSRMVGTQRIALATNTSLIESTRIVVTPTKAAQDFLTAVMTRRVTTGTAADFAGLFSTVDFGSATSQAVWVAQGDGSVGQTNTNAAFGPNGQYSPLTPSLALVGKMAASPISHAGVSFNCGTNPGSAGIAFNWISNADFWIFYNDLVWQVHGFSGATPFMTCSVQHIVNGQVTQSFAASGGLQPPSDASGRVLVWSADLDIGTSASGLVFQCNVRWANGRTNSFALAPTPGVANYPQNFILGSKLGLMVRGKGDIAYTRLQWTDTADGAVNILPAGSAGSILLRLVAKPSLLRTLNDTQLMMQGFPPPRAAPEPDFETTFFVTPAPTGYYGYTYAGAVVGIGSDPL